MKRKLNVDLEDLEIAFQAENYELPHYLDLETGEIIAVMQEYASQLDEIYEEIYDEAGERTVSLEAYLEDADCYDWEKEMLLTADEVEQGYQERYIPVEKDDPHADYRDMERFIETVADEAIRERLWRAIQGRGAFRYFKDVLYDYPEVREAWFEFKDQRSQRRAEEWLRARGIELSS